VRNRLWGMGFAALLSGAGCTAPINTVPAPVSPTAAVQYYDLEVPPDLEIRSVGYGATTFTEVSGADGSTGSAVGGRAFLRVDAVHRTTGERYLLLYEDIEHRKRPVQIIRFVPGQDGARPDSIR
jgi:hypothetical protein